jgi:predicted protein tyrosine phosphatase
MPSSALNIGPELDSRASPMIYVCNLHDMPGHVDALGPSHLVSLVAPPEQPPTPPGIQIERHLRLEIHDITEPMDGYILPDVEHMELLIGFLREWRHEEAPLLVHCVAGISRSMAAAMIALVIKAGGNEMAAAQRIREAAPHAYPNRRMIALADELLGCGGRLIAARDAMGPADISAFGPLVHLPLLPISERGFER